MKAFAVEDKGEENGADPDLILVVFTPFPFQVPFVCEGTNDWKSASAARFRGVPSGAS